MIETAEAITSTFDAMLETISEMDAPNAPKLRRSTVSAIRYRKRTFKSTLLRVYSLERRAMSSTQLHQALFAQTDAHAMKFVAVLTLFFLPVTGVSTVFSSPFFNVDFDKDSTPLRVAWCFWKFWAVVAPMTLGIGALCYLWFRFPDFFSFSHESWMRESWSQFLERRTERRKQEKAGV
jgi:Mg2+ and Co2+ transporter CorA